MRKIEWNESYSVGVKAFDFQHQEIFDCLNTMFEIIDNISQSDQLAELFIKLEKYSIDHFSAEEILFSKYKYYDIDNHKKEHHLYNEKIASFKKRLNSSDEQVSQEILGFLVDWWMGHIQGCDKDYTRFMNNNGVF